MHISRIQVDGGFLAGLDLRLPAGLIAVVGARGTGKTSLIELIRYGLGAKNYTPEAAAESTDHARSILEGGEVALTLDDVLEEISVVRSADDELPRASTSLFHPPIVFSQKEIETVGASASGRLSLIDGFVRGRGRSRAKEAELANSIRSLYREMAVVEAEIARTSDGIEDLGALISQLDAIEKRAGEGKAASQAVAKRQEDLGELSAQISNLSVESSVLERFRDQVMSWTHTLDEPINADFGVPKWSPAGEDVFVELRREYEDAVKQVRLASERFKKISYRIDSRRENCEKARLKLEEQFRQSRSEIEKIVEGAGALARQAATLKSRIGQVQAVQQLVQERTERLTLQREQRDVLLDLLERARHERYLARREVAEQLNAALGPQIDVRIEKYGQFGDYVRALTEALRGSGIKYNEVVSRIAENVSPRELSSYVETDDAAAFSGAADLPKERAGRILGALKEAGLSEIVTCNLEDDVRLRLLDGAEYKDISSLSAGQRCTIVLPIVLQHNDRILVIDQPEDHIDNAFIAETLIRSLRSRSADSQTIVSTHNANIPVLGGAQLVVQMISDGRNGSVEVCQPVDHPASVAAITSVMEGGLAAFQNRAKFYEEHGCDPGGG